MKNRLFSIGLIVLLFLFFNFCKDGGDLIGKVGDVLSDNKIELKTEMVKQKEFLGLRINIKNITNDNIELYWVLGKISCDDKVSVFNPCLSYPAIDGSYWLHYGVINTDDLIKRKSNFPKFLPAKIKPLKEFKIGVLFQCKNPFSIVEINVRFGDGSESGPFKIELNSSK